ncbi:MAG: thioredoxin domain-containing protein [Bdellovibrionota bacterium]
MKSKAKKDVYIITGIMALIIAGFIFAYARYSKPVASIEETEGSGPNLMQVDLPTLMGSGEPSMGPTMAKVVVVEFLDPECEACRAFHPRVKKVLSEFEGKVRYLIRYMPYHHNSANAIKALYAANQQGKVWEYLDLLFNKQSDWGEKRDDKTELLMNYAKELNLDISTFKKDFASEAAAARVKKDEADGQAVGVNGTPTFYINGVPLLELGEDPLRTAISSAFNE